MKRMSSAAADALTFGGFGDDSPSRELNAVVSGELSPQRKRKVFSDYASPRRKKKIKATDGPRKSGVRTSSPGKGVGGWEDGTRGNGAQMEDLPPRRGGFSPRRREEVSNLEDLTPPRRRKQGSPVHDLSPLRKRKDDGHTEDLSPPRQKKGSSPEEDLSPPRRRPVTVSPRRRKESSGVEDLSSGRRRRESMAVGDLSPPRRNENRALEDISPPRRRRDNNIVQNISPSRRRKERGTLEGLSPPRRSHGDGQFKDRKDLSPPRRNLENRSPPRRSYGDGQFKDRKDLSPPRRNLEDRSPPRRNHGDGQLKDRKDLSPPRRTLNDRSSPRRNHGDGQFKDRKDFSPPRRILDDRSSPRRNHGDGQFKDRKDLSPPRKTLEDRSPPRRNHGDGQLKDRKDSSPPRRTLEALSPPRRSHGHGDGRFKDRKDLSPPRRTLEDLSPSRRSQGDGQFKDRKGLSPARRSHDDGQFQDRRQLNRRDEHLGSRTLDRHEDVDDTKKRMLDGAATGLRTDKEIKVDIERKRNAELRGLAAMDASQSGRGAETIYRDRRGKRLEGLEELLRQQEGLKKPEAKPLEWGKGLVQKREADIKQQELEAEASKPFARSRDDPELDKSLREKIRWGDPMAHLVKPPEPELEDIGARENMKESGFSIPQDMPMHSWIKRKIGPPPNRYGIKPGRHWDGVDRSNGFEQKMFKQQNEKRARDQEAYAWSVADM